jgi:hypothetical protein
MRDGLILVVLSVSATCVIRSGWAGPDNLDRGAHVTLGDPNKPFVLDGKIDGASTATITGQTIWIKEKIDHQSTVHLTATSGGITIGDKIDGGAQVTMNAAGEIIVGGKIDGENPRTKVLWCAPGLDVRGGMNGKVPVDKLPDCKYNK